jgi:hypothetical protein
MDFKEEEEEMRGEIKGIRCVREMRDIFKRRKEITIQTEEKSYIIPFNLHDLNTGR